MLNITLKRMPQHDGFSLLISVERICKALSLSVLLMHQLQKSLRQSKSLLYSQPSNLKLLTRLLITPWIWRHQTSNRHTQAVMKNLMLLV